MVMIFFIKLRHGLSDEDIADRFDVHSWTVYGQKKTVPLIKWPDMSDNQIVEESTLSLTALCPVKDSQLLN